MFLWRRHGNPHRLSKRDCAKWFMEGLADMPMGNRQAHRSNQLKIQH
jgi:hypothetical protein